MSLLWLAFGVLTVFLRRTGHRRLPAVHPRRCDGDRLPGAPVPRAGAGEVVAAGTRVRCSTSPVDGRAGDRRWCAARASRSRRRDWRPGRRAAGRGPRRARRRRCATRTPQPHRRHGGDRRHPDGAAGGAVGARHRAGAPDRRLGAPRVPAPRGLPPLAVHMAERPWSARRASSTVSGKAERRCDGPRSATLGPRVSATRAPPITTGGCRWTRRPRCARS